MEFSKSRMKMRFHDVVESFYIETLEGYFFSVKGLEHPPERLIAVLRYVPDKERGDRRKDGTRYRRLYSFEEQEGFIKRACPQYFVNDPTFRTKLQSVPRSSVKRLYDPRMRLQELLKATTGSEIEENAAAFTRLLEEKTGVSSSNMGITGSLLIGLHKDMSDLDMAVFGAQNCKQVYQGLRGLLDSKALSELCRLDPRGMNELYAERAADMRMDFADFVSLESRKVNQGRFRQTMYFIRFVQDKHEAGDEYGGRQYTPIGRANISATVSDDGEAIFTPCKYAVSEVHSLDGNSLPDLKEIVSFRGRFCEQARKGESIIAAGTMEHVQSGQGDVWYRLLLGNSPEDTIVVQK